MLPNMREHGSFIWFDLKEAIDFYPNSEYNTFVQIRIKERAMKPNCSREMAEVNRLYKETEGIYSRYAALHNVSTTTLCVLYSLYTADLPCTQSQLVEDWGIPMQTINSSLKALEKDGLVRLDYAEGSRKRKHIHFTESGAELAGRIVAPMVRAENEAFALLLPEEQQLLLNITRKHNGLLRELLLNQN